MVTADQDGPEHAPRIVDDDHTAALMAGYDPNPVDSTLAAHIAELVAKGNLPPGLDEAVSEWVYRFQHQTETRLIGALADAGNMAYSEALHRYRNPDDIASAFGWIAYNALDQTERHPACGTRPDDWFDFDHPSGKTVALDPGPWKFKLVDCYGCRRLSELNEDLSEEDKKRGTRYVIAPRGPDDPEIDDGGFVGSRPA